ncbi:MAG: InlB B-repeat-containing protein [Clostridiales bacterium]|nr:InlB B-repeat-containing protein [Clostridiales bacterium]
MGRKLGLTGRFTAMVLSIVLVINSIGLTVFAANDTHLDGNKKIGSYTDHATITYAVVDKNTTDFSNVEFQSEMDFSVVDDLRNGGKDIFAKIVIDPGYTLERFWYKASAYAWTSATVVDPDNGIYKYSTQPEPGMEIVADLTVVPTEYHVTFAPSDRYTVSNIYKNGDSTFDPATATAHAWDDTISFTVSAVDGCSINDVTATRADNGASIALTPSGVSWSFTVPDSDVNINIGSSSDTYYCATPGADRTYLEPGQYTFVDNITHFDGEARDFFVVRDNYTASDIVAIEGNVKLVICDGKKFTAPDGIYLYPGASLTIYGQEENTGCLEARNCTEADKYYQYVSTNPEYIAYYAVTSNGSASFTANGGQLIFNSTSKGYAVFNNNINISIANRLCVSAGSSAGSSSLVLRGNNSGSQITPTDNAVMIALKSDPYAEIGVCSHPVSDQSMYVHPGTDADLSNHQHKIALCIYCAAGEGVIQEHEYDEDGHCGCNYSSAYRITASGDSASYGTYYENGAENEWFLDGETAVIRITPPAGYASTATFTNAGSSTGSGSFVNPYKVVISGSNINMAVVNTRVYDIDVVSENGTVRVKNFYGGFSDNSTDRVASAGQTVSLDPVSNDGYTLRNITVTAGNDDIPVTRNTLSGYYEFTMPAEPVTVTAEFMEGSDSYTITVPSFEHGSVVVDKSSAAAGEAVTLTVLAARGYHLASLAYGRGGAQAVDITIGENQSSYSIVMPSYDVTVYATFAPSSYALTYPSNANYDFHATTTAVTSAATDSTVTVDVKPADGVHIYGIKYKYTLSGIDYTVSADYVETYSTGYMRYTFTMPAADVEVVADYGYNITVTAPQYGLSVTCNGEEVSYARPGETIDVKWVDRDFRIHSINVNGTRIAGSTFTMPAGAVTLSVEESDLDPVYEYVTIDPDHGTLVLKDSQGHETNDFIAGEEVYVELIPDDRYRLQCSSLDIDIQYATRRGSQIFTSDNYTFHSTGKYTLHFTCEAVYEGGFISLRDGVTYDHLIPDRYRVKVSDSASEYVTMDSADEYYYAGSTVTLTLNPYQGKRLTSLTIETSPGFVTVPYVMSADKSTVTFTMPESWVDVYVENVEASAAYFYYDPVMGTQYNLNSVNPWAGLNSSNEATLSTGWYSTGEATTYNSNTVIRIGEGQNVNILVCDGDSYKLQVASILLEEGASLTIWGQTRDNNGTLICNAASTPLPGIGAASGVGNAYITINGCRVEATGGANSSGIGRCTSNSLVGNNINISINYGNVIAKGGSKSAGIGGSNKSPVNRIHIKNATVDARGGNNAAGIGAGSGSSIGEIMIVGGTIVASGGSGGAGIGGGKSLTGTGNKITISGGTVTAVGEIGGAGIGTGYTAKGETSIDIKISGGTVYAHGSNYDEDDEVGAGAGIGTGANSACEINVTVSGGNVAAVAGTSENPAHVTTRAQSVGFGEGARGTMTFIIGDEMSVTGYPGGSLSGVSEKVTVDRTSSEVIDNRLTSGETYTCLEILPCEHDGVAIAYVPNDIDHHQEICPYCLRNSDEIDHSFDENGYCECGAFLVSFDGNGGSGTMDPMIVEPESQGADVNIGFPECGFETGDDAMIFAGWKIGDQTYVEDDGDIIINEPVTLVAQWTSYSISVADAATSGQHITIDGVTGASYGRIAPANSTVTIHVEAAEGYRVSTVAYYVNTTTEAVGMMNYSGNGDYSFVMPESNVSLVFDVRKTCGITLMTEGEGATITATAGVEDSTTYEGATVRVSIDYTDESASLYSLEVKCGDTVLSVTGIDPASPYDATEFEFVVPDAVNGELGDIVVSAVFANGYVVTYATQITGTIEGAEDRFVGGPDHKIPAGTTVVFTVTPAGGYAIMNVSALATPGYKPVTLTALGNDQYSFVMPENNVSIGATFFGMRTITYDANGGSGIMPSAEVRPGTQFQLPANNFDAPAGAEFIGWTINDGTTLYDPGDEITVGTDRVTNFIHAQWKSTWTAVQASVAQGRDITLLNSIFGLEGAAGVDTYVDNGNIVVGSDVNVTIDLNGFTIDRKGGFTGDAATTYHVFDVAGKLTVIDSSTDKTGVITGSDLGVVLNGDSDTKFTLISGRITGMTNRAVSVGQNTNFLMTGGSIDNNGGGVTVQKYGKFKITGGTITENTTGSAGSAVEVLAHSEFEMTGGTITGNRIEVEGSVPSGTYGAVYVNNYATMKISGNPVITGNTRCVAGQESVASNLYLYSLTDSQERFINITDTLDSTAAIGVDVSAMFGGPITSGLPEYGSIDNFSCDKSWNTSYDIGLTLDGEAIMGFRRAVIFHAGEGSGTMANDNIYYYDVAYTIPECTFTPPEGKVFDKWMADDNPDYMYAPGDRMALTVEYVQHYMDFYFDLTATWKDPEPEFVGHSAILKDEIGLQFALRLPEGTTEDDYNDVSVTLTGNNIDESFDSLGQIDSRGVYRFTVYLASYQMADLVTPTLTYTDSEGVEHTIVGEEYSVELYLQKMISNFETNPDEYASYGPFINLAKAMLNYGYYGQIFLARQNGWAYGEKYAAVTYHYDDVLASREVARSAASTHIFSKTIEGSGVTAVNYQLVLGSTTDLMIRLTLEDGVTVTGYSGLPANVTTSASGKYYTITIPEIYASRLMNDYSFVVTTSEGEASVFVSPMSMVYTRLSNDQTAEDSVDCMRAFYSFAAAAKN